MENETVHWFTGSLVHWLEKRKCGDQDKWIDLYTPFITFWRLDSRYVSVKPFTSSTS